ncbi:MAG: S-adenosylmethionine decarboxylase [Gemmatimonadales bacterium]
MDAAFNYHLDELTGISGTRLADSAGLCAVLVAAASAIGMSPLGPPISREGAGGSSVALLCRDGHIVLHTVPHDGFCFVTVVARAPVDAGRGVDVIARALSRESGRAAT